MKGSACNPYLPGKWHIPDGEPHIFDGRLYVYGSHDETGAENYCTGPYVGWSAPLDDPGDWRYEGVILEKGQDPLDPDGTKSYYAPDVAKGPDGRYYLYYSIEDSSVISVAVCGSPAGKYEFYGHVHDRNGHVLGSEKGDDYQFDPAVLVDDDGKIYLYSGQGMPVEEMNGRKVRGALVCELAEDMVTAVAEQKVLTSGKENCFTENPFFEASSIRKIGQSYYFIYSPIPNVHNLCYAVSSYPDREFAYQGVLVSNGGIDASGKGGQIPEYYWGNNHGSILELDGELFVFYHRHTNKSSWCRQGCAERLEMKAGMIRQAEMTSQGMRKDPFPFGGKYFAYTACILKKKDMKAYVPFQFLEFNEDDPYITQEEETEAPYIANFRDGSQAGYRYFRFEGTEKTVRITVRGSGEGKFMFYGERSGLLAEIQVSPKEQWGTSEAPVRTPAGTDTLMISYQGSGSVDILSFEAE